MVIEIPLEGALSLNNIRVNVPSTFTVGISTDPVLMNNAAERLLGLGEHRVREQAQDIILGQLRLVIATRSRCHRSMSPPPRYRRPFSRKALRCPRS